MEGARVVMAYEMHETPTYELEVKFLPGQKV